MALEAEIDRFAAARNAEAARDRPPAPSPRPSAAHPERDLVPICIKAVTLFTKNSKPLGFLIGLPMAGCRVGGPVPPF